MLLRTHIPLAKMRKRHHISQKLIVFDVLGHLFQTERMVLKILQSFLELFLREPLVERYTESIDEVAVFVPLFFIPPVRHLTVDFVEEALRIRAQGFSLRHHNWLFFALFLVGLACIGVGNRGRVWEAG